MKDTTQATQETQKTQEATFEPNLIREILLDANGIPLNEVANGFSYPHWEQKQVDKYTHLLTEEELLNGFPIREVKNFFRITGLSEKGETFLENTKDEKAWEKVVEQCKDKNITTIKGLLHLLSHSNNT